MSRRAPLFVAIAFALLAILAVVFLVMPKISDVGDAEDELEATEAEFTTLQAQLQQLQAAAEDAGELRRELARFRRLVPPVADLPGLINLLQTAADVAGVDFFSISPAQPTPVAGANASEIPAQIQVIGGFFPVDAFLSRLETLPRAAKVVGIQVAAGPDGAPQIDVQMDVRFYTTDLEAGPGAPVVAATPTPSPGASPAVTPTPVTSPTPGA